MSKAFSVDHRILYFSNSSHAAQPLAYYIRIPAWNFQGTNWKPLFSYLILVLFWFFVLELTI